MVMMMHQDSNSSPIGMMMMIGAAPDSQLQRYSQSNKNGLNVAPQGSSEVDVENSEEDENGHLQIQFGSGSSPSSSPV